MDERAKIHRELEAIQRTNSAESSTPRMIPLMNVAQFIVPMSFGTDTNLLVTGSLSLI